MEATKALRNLFVSNLVPLLMHTKPCLSNAICLATARLIVSHNLGGYIAALAALLSKRSVCT